MRKVYIHKYISTYKLMKYTLDIMTIKVYIHMCADPAL